MPWLFNQLVGQLTHNGRAVASGYSGRGPGKNNPTLEAAHGAGSTPLGVYSVGAPNYSNNTGVYTMNLDPQPGTNTWGRTLLRIHGDNPKHLAESSDGCIILPRAVRHSIWVSGDHILQVVR